MAGGGWQNWLQSAINGYRCEIFYHLQYGSATARKLQSKYLQGPRTVYSLHLGTVQRSGSHAGRHHHRDGSNRGCVGDGTNAPLCLLLTMQRSKDDASNAKVVTLGGLVRGSVHWSLPSMDLAELTCIIDFSRADSSLVRRCPVNRAEWHATRRCPIPKMKLANPTRELEVIDPSSPAWQPCGLMLSFTAMLSGRDTGSFLTVKLAVHDTM